MISGSFLSNALRATWSCGITKSPTTFLNKPMHFLPKRTFIKTTTALLRPGITRTIGKKSNPHKASYITSVLAISFTASQMNVALAEGNKGADEIEKIKAAIEEFTKSASKKGLSLEVAQKSINDFLDSGAGGQISWGFMMGFCSGLAARKFSSFSIFLVGSLFMGIQVASYNGYLHIDYGKMEREMTNVMDVNKDGKVDIHDIRLIYNNIMKVLEFSIPAGAGYGAGFLVGLKRG